MFAGMIIVPLAISDRTSFGGDLLLVRDVGHLLGDEALAREVHLAHVPVAGTGGLSLTVDDPLLARHGNYVAVVVYVTVTVCGVAVAVRMSVTVGAHMSESPTRTARISTRPTILCYRESIRRVS